MARPKVSIVFAWMPATKGCGITGDATLASLAKQDYAASNVEIVVCRAPGSPALGDCGKIAGLRVVESPDGGYYRLKNFGIAQARGDIVAMADSDCIYAPQWVSEIVATIESGADVSVGFSRLEGDSLFRRLCSYFDLQQMLLRSPGGTRRFKQCGFPGRSRPVLRLRPAFRPHRRLRGAGASPASAWRSDAVQPPAGVCACVLRCASAYLDTGCLRGLRLSPFEGD